MQNRRGPPKRVGRLLSGLQLDSCGDASGRTAAGRNAGSDQLHRHGALADLGGGGRGTAGVARQSESSRSSRATGHQGSSGHLSKDDQTPCVPPKTPAMDRAMTLKLMPFETGPIILSARPELAPSRFHRRYPTRNVLTS